MPTYEYECGCCGSFEAMRPLAEYRTPQPCPRCGSASPRVVLSVAALASMPGETRKAHAINERAAHEPKTSSSLKHGSGCSCCASPGIGKGSTLKTPGGAKLFPSKRPWMISH